MKRVILHIDRLALNGFCEADRQRLASVVQARLARVFGESETVRQLIAAAGVPHLQLGHCLATTRAIRKETLP